MQAECRKFIKKLYTQLLGIRGLTIPVDLVTIFGF